MRHTIKYGPKILTALWMFLFLPSADLKGQSFELEPHQQLARDILQEIIEINTVDSAGTTKAAKALERRLLEAGFSDEDVDVVGPKQKKMTDGKGLFLLLHPNGSKYWRMKYQFSGKEKTLAFGVWPEVSLTEAREMRNEAKLLLKDGKDPSGVKKSQKLNQKNHPFH